MSTSTRNAGLHGYHPSQRLRTAQSDSSSMATPWIGGVCSGLASYLGISVVSVRIAFAALSAVGVGIVAYLLLWLFLPSDSEVDRAEETLRAPLRDVGPKRDNQVAVGRLFVVGSAFVVAGTALAIVPTIYGRSWLLIAGVAIMAGIGLTWMQAPKIASKRRWSAVALMALGLALLAAGTAILADWFGWLPALRDGLVVTLLMLLVVSLALAPFVYRLFRDLTASKANEARETERAEIAAHLHDSVLQTLTLIRGAADDPSRVRSLALTQEGELRSWLYTGNVEPAESVAQALRDQASGIETTYGTAVEVVTVGDAVPAPAELAAVAAASEAITNAVRHGAPPITVFQEVGPDGIEISIKDAGAGFDPDEIPSDRHGFRSSILGRVTRVGGQVTVRSVQATDLSSDQVADTGNEVSRSGTEIRIQVPRHGKTLAKEG
ncbi:PspC domain-containing protein [Actinomycetaceae bacterium MB13-C1-2]|nr:PspC domain-containing protein [Actinomycetaceae bacterium MB13-C1-2]